MRVGSDQKLFINNSSIEETVRRETPATVRGERDSTNCPWTWAIGQDPWRSFITYYVCLLWSDTSYMEETSILLSPSLHFLQTPIVKARSTEATLLAPKLQDQVQSLLKQCTEWCCTTLPFSLCCSRTLTSMGYIFSLPPKWPSVTWRPSSTSQLPREEGGCEQSH